MVVTVPLPSSTLLSNVRYKWIAAGVAGAELSSGITQPNPIRGLFRLNVTPPDNAEELIVYDTTSSRSWNIGIKRSP